MPMQNHVHPSQGAHGLVQSFGQGYGDIQTSQVAQYGATTPSSSVNEQVGEVLINN